jgi:hypothetical protein
VNRQAGSWWDGSTWACLPGPIQAWRFKQSQPGRVWRVWCRRRKPKENSPGRALVESVRRGSGRAVRWDSWPVFLRRASGRDRGRRAPDPNSGSTQERGMGSAMQRLPDVIAMVDLEPTPTPIPTPIPLSRPTPTPTPRPTPIPGCPNRGRTPGVQACRRAGVRACRVQEYRRQWELVHARMPSAALLHAVAHVKSGRDFNDVVRSLRMDPELRRSATDRVTGRRWLYGRLV